MIQLLRKVALGTAEKLAMMVTLVALALTLTDLEARGPLVVPRVVPGVVEVVAEHELPEPGALAEAASVVADVDGFSRFGPHAASRREMETHVHNLCFATTCVCIINAL